MSGSVPDVVRTSSEEETLAWAREFGKSLKGGDCVLLSGPLGAGKTVVCRGVAQGRGFSGRTGSPTYSIVREYRCEPPIYHVDLYRLPEGADWEEIGLEHYRFSDAITVIEWPERLAGLDLEVTATVELKPVGESGRVISVARCQLPGASA